MCVAIDLLRCMPFPTPTETFENPTAADVFVQMNVCSKQTLELSPIHTRDDAYQMHKAFKLTPQTVPNQIFRKQ